MSRKKVSTTIYVTPEQNERLKVLHDRTKVPVAVYIREGIDLVLRQYAHLLPGQLPLDVTPPPGAVASMVSNGAAAMTPATMPSDESDETPSLPLGTEAFETRLASGKK